MRLHVHGHIKFSHVLKVHIVYGLKLAIMIQQAIYNRIKLYASKPTAIVSAHITYHLQPWSHGIFTCTI